MKRLFPALAMLVVVATAASAGVNLTTAKLNFKIYRDNLAKKTDPAELQSILLKAETSALKAVEKEDSDDEEAWFLLGQIQYELKKYREMVESFDKSMAIDPEHKEDIYRYKQSLWVNSHNAGIKYYNLGIDSAHYFDMAIDSLKVAMVAMPDSLLSWYVCGLVHYAKRDYNGAKSILSLVVEKDPKRTDALDLLGKTHLQLAQIRRDAKDEPGAKEELKLAGAVYEKYYDLSPGDAESLTRLLSIYRQAGMNDKVVALTTGCIETTPNNRDCRFAYGNYLVEEKKFADATQQFQAVIDLEPFNEDELHKNAVYNLGVTYLNWGVALREEAEKKAEEAQKAAKGKKKSTAVAEDMSYKEKFKQALPYFEKTAEFKKDDPTIYTQLGRLYANLNMTKEAKAAYDTADRLVKEGK